MRYVKLSGVDKRVSILSLGVYSLTGMYGEVPREHAVRFLRKCYDMGINFYDTADFYGRGLGEALLYEAFEKDVDEIVIATKIGYDFYHSSKPTRRYDPEYLEFALKKSLERLNRDYVDLLYLHNPPLDVLRKDGLWKTLERFKVENMALQTGIALGPEVNVLPHSQVVLERRVAKALQFVYNMLEQYPGRIIAERARMHGVDVVVRVPHAGGVLDESLRQGQEEGLKDHRTLRRRGWYDWAFTVYSKMREHLKNHPGTPGQKALKFIEQTINPKSIVVIANDMERLMDYLGFLEIPDIPGRVVEEIMRIHDLHVHENPELSL